MQLPWSSWMPGRCWLFCCFLDRTDPFRKWISSDPCLSYFQAPEHSWHFLSGVFPWSCMLRCQLLLVEVTGSVYMLTSIWQVADQQLELTDILQHTFLLASLSTPGDYGSHLEWQEKVVLGNRGCISFISIAAGASSNRVVTAMPTMKVQPAVFLWVLVLQSPFTSAE